VLEILREVEVFVFGFGGEGKMGTAAGAEVCVSRWCRDDGGSCIVFVVFIIGVMVVLFVGWEIASGIWRVDLVD